MTRGVGVLLLSLSLGVGCTARSTNTGPVVIPEGDGGPFDVELPDGALPDVVLPDGALPDVILPDGALPDGAPPACTAASQCADSVACTDDTCVSGVCVHTPVPSRCAAGSVCDQVMGCRASRVCATDGECADTDPCTRNERCDPTQRLCVSSPLDGDGDGEPPRACGGNDCNDADRAVGPSQAERCNGADDDCDGMIDEAPAGAECGAGASCAGGRCACAAGQTLCAGRCLDTSADPLNCGACGVSCGVGGSCASGRCACPTGQAFCGGRCIDVQSSASNCGGCGTACASGESCVGGLCGATCAGLTVVDLARSGTLSGATRRYVGDTSSAWAAQNPGGTAAASSPITPPSTCAPGRGLVVHRYTVGAAGGSLRISTRNPGTATTFDTVLWVTGTCARTLSAAACNDDDQTVAGSPTYQSTALVGPIAGGTTLYIVVGGYFPAPADGSLTDRGAYELTVEERPLIAVGGACSTDASTGVCATGSTCVGDSPFAATGVCRATGTAAGAACRGSSPACDTGLVCEVQPTPSGSSVSVCARQGAASAVCDLGVIPAFRTCASGLECYSAVTGSRVGACVSAGSQPGARCRPTGSTGGRCDAGLTCDADIVTSVTNPTCRRLVSSGGGCDRRWSVCAAGSTCVASVAGSNQGLCRGDGTVAGARCRATSLPCDSAMQCRAFADGASYCAIEAASGSACALETYTICSGDASCFYTDLTNRYIGRCADPGQQGGECDGTVTCVGATSCSVAAPTTTAPGVCQMVSAEGAACERPLSRCAPGLTCVLNSDSETAGTCRRNGSVAGAQCAASPTCGAGLTCSGTAADGWCQADRALGAACDPIRGSTRCTGGAVCRATSTRAGTCVAAAGAEAEPNNAPSTSLPRASAATALTASLTRGEVDCYAVTVPSGGGVFAQVSDGQGLCPLRSGGTVALDLYATDGVTLLGTTTSSGPGVCATLDGARRGVYDWATGLAAGTYYVCARVTVPTTGVTGAIDRYVFSLSPLPPR